MITVVWALGLQKKESHVIGKNTHFPCRVTLFVCSFLLPVA